MRQRSVLKVSLPKQLKYEFKSRCAERGITMTFALEQLTEYWLKSEDFSDFPCEIPSNEDNDLEDLKTYITASRKKQFKVACAEREIAQRLVLYSLLKRWIKGEL
jgi:hypothetical protein